MRHVTRLFVEVVTDITDAPVKQYQIEEEVRAAVRKALVDLQHRDGRVREFDLVYIPRLV